MMYMSGSSLRAAMFSTLVLLIGLSTSSSKDRPADAADPPPTTDADVLAEIARYASDNGLSGLSPASLAPVGDPMPRVFATSVMERPAACSSTARSRSTSRRWW